MSTILLIDTLLTGLYVTLEWFQRIETVWWSEHQCNVEKLFIISDLEPSTKESLTKSQCMFWISVSCDRFGTQTPMFILSFFFFIKAYQLIEIRMCQIKRRWELFVIIRFNHIFFIHFIGSLKLFAVNFFRFVNVYKKLYCSLIALSVVIFW